MSSRLVTSAFLQTALSRSIKKIEEELGVPLFDCSKSRIALNETGKVAAKYALRVLEAEQEMREQTLAFERNRRTLSIGACAALPAFASSQTALLGYDRATGRTAVPLSDTSARADYYLVCLREEKERFLPFFAAASEHTP